MIEASVTSTLPEEVAIDFLETFERIGKYKSEYVKDDIHRLFSQEQSSGHLAASTKYRPIQDGVEIYNDAHYAWIQNDPNPHFIKGSPVTVTHSFNPRGTTPTTQRAGRLPKPFVTTQMSRFFLAMFFNTGNEKYRAMAIVARRDGGVTVTGRNFMKWTDEDIQWITQQLSDKVVSFFGAKGEKIQ